jgi:hypothetical protein
MLQARHRYELGLELIMRRAVATAFLASLLALPLGAAADDPPTVQPAPEQPSAAGQPKANAAAKLPAPAGHDESGPKPGVSPVAITAKRTNPHLDLRLTSQRLNQVLNDSGVEPVAEEDPAIDTIEVTAHRVELEPITPGIPALYYGITHPTEAWRIFAPIQP